MKDLVTVLDLGSTKAVCLAATAGDNGEVVVQAVGTAECKGVKRGVVTDLEDTARAIDTAIRRVQTDLGVSIEEVIVGISGSHVEGINAQGYVPIYPRSRSITREDVLQVINHSRQVMIPPDREMIQAIPREFVIDGQRGIQKPIGMSGSKLEAVTYIVTGQQSLIQNVEKAISNTGRSVEQMILLPLASGLGVLTQEEITLGAVVVDIGGGTTDVGIFSNGSIAASACLPLGGGHVTSDISKLLKTSPEEAERLKIEFGAALARVASENDSVEVMQIGQSVARPLQRRVLCEIVESRMREIAVMVKQQIEKSGLVGMLPGGLVVTGGGSQLEATDKLFAEVLKHLRVRQAEPHIPAKFGSDAGTAAAMGMARFAIQCYEDELGPAGGSGDWKGKIRTLWSVLSGKA